jgi:hypothetical protein
MPGRGRGLPLGLRVYGIDSVNLPPAPSNSLLREIFILGECVAPTAERAGVVGRTTRPLDRLREILAQL